MKLALFVPLCWFMAGTAGHVASGSGKWEFQYDRSIYRARHRAWEYAPMH